MTDERCAHEGCGHWRSEHLRSRRRCTVGLRSSGPPFDGACQCPGYVRPTPSEPLCQHSDHGKTGQMCLNVKDPSVEFPDRPDPGWHAFVSGEPEPRCSEPFTNMGENFTGNTFICAREHGHTGDHAPTFCTNAEDCGCDGGESYAVHGEPTESEADQGHTSGADPSDVAVYSVRKVRDRFASDPPDAELEARVREILNKHLSGAESDLRASEQTEILSDINWAKMMAVDDILALIRAIQRDLPNG